jgi:hypothetical protein
MLAFQCNAMGIGRWVLVQGGAWSPDENVVSDIAASIQTYVQEQAKASGKEMKLWSTYTFQYQGRIDYDKKLVFVNALCTKESVKRLQKNIVLVLDGGSCFFNLLYDPTSRKFSNLVVNGDA